MDQKRVALIGATGALGQALSRELAALPDVELLTFSRRGSGASERSGARSTRALDRDDTAALETALRGVHLAIDASGPFQGRNTASAASALRAGAHWLDLADARDYVEGFADLNGLALERGRTALCSAGMFCALSGAMARELLRDLVKVNELLLGVVGFSGGELGLASYTSWLFGFGAPLPMKVGGEWTEREYFGDRRRFPHPPPFGLVFSYNLATPELDLFAGPTLKASSVRVSLGFLSWLEARVFRSLARKLKTPVKAVGERSALAARVRLWSKRLRPRGARAQHKAFSVIARGLSATNLPSERRLSVVAESPEPRLAVLPALILARQLLSDSPPKPGARSAGVELAWDAVEPQLHMIGARAVRGDLGGWH